MIDASALLAILLEEPEARNVRGRIASADGPFTSPLAVYETVARLVRLYGMSPQQADAIVRALLKEYGAKVVAVDDTITPHALDALDRYGRGRHPARLNFGDCFAYACARAHDAPLIYKGDDFAKTDLA
ncbi:MAG: type II toxin-antitoxin system VapC family toxin [Methylobacteriaceae bacterium]|nr:type II toxin-antitoxin system VapC family toxin [Methylobacteriaceae bacterium]